jgi:hypothetical protein
VVPVAHHEAVPVSVDLVGVRLEIRGDLRLQRRREHRPRTIANNRIEQRPTERANLVGLVLLLDYREHRRTFPNQRANAGPDQSFLAIGSSSGRCASSRHQAEDHPQVLIIARRAVQDLEECTEQVP